MNKKTQDRLPLESPEPMKIARRVLQDSFSVGGFQHLLFFRGHFWEYYGERWEKRDRRWMRHRLFQELEDAVVMKTVRTEEGTKQVGVRFAPDTKKVDNVLDALESLPEICRDYKTIPAWLKGHSSKPDPESLIGFADVLVPVGPEPRVTLPRDPTWFDPCVVPVSYDPAAQCPVWRRCLGQWGRGSELWETLLRRWFGYCLMNHRRYSKWLLMKGKPRAGKGTIAKVLERLIGPAGFNSARGEQLKGDFNLMGFESSRVLSITEMDCEDKRIVTNMSALIKILVGGDPQNIPVKFQPPLMNVIIPAAPMVQANRVPRLPDIGGGVSTKMLILPFHWSALDPGQKLDHRLDQKLLEELPGIAAWAVCGARELEAGLGFPVLEEAEEDLEEYRLENSPMDVFLDECFVRDPNGFVSTSLLESTWEQWRVRKKIATIIPKTRIRNEVMEKSSWSLSPYRIRNGPRGIVGLSPKEDLRLA